MSHLFSVSVKNYLSSGGSEELRSCGTIPRERIIPLSLCKRPYAHVLFGELCSRSCSQITDPLGFVAR